MCVYVCVYARYVGGADFEISVLFSGFFFWQEEAERVEAIRQLAVDGQQKKQNLNDGVCTLPCVCVCVCVCVYHACVCVCIICVYVCVCVCIMCVCVCDTHAYA